MHDEWQPSYHELGVGGAHPLQFKGPQSTPPKSYEFCIFTIKKKKTPYIPLKKILDINCVPDIMNKKASSD